MVHLYALLFLTTQAFLSQFMVLFVRISFSNSIIKKEVYSHVFSFLVPWHMISKILKIVCPSDDRS